MQTQHNQTNINVPWTGKDPLVAIPQNSNVKPTACSVERCVSGHTGHGVHADMKGALSIAFDACYRTLSIERCNGFRVILVSHSRVYAKDFKSEGPKYLPVCSTTQMPSMTPAQHGGQYFPDSPEGSMGV